jgi:hypothetical protein
VIYLERPLNGVIGVGYCVIIQTNLFGYSQLLGVTRHPWKGNFTSVRVRSVIRPFFLNELEKNGILREITGREWGKIYLASAIADAIQNPA